MFSMFCLFVFVFAWPTWVYYYANKELLYYNQAMLSGPAQKMSRERLREIKKKDDISDTHKSTGQSRPTIVVGIKKSFY